MSLPGANFVKNNTICLLFDVPAGGSFHKKTRFVFLSMCLPGANFVENILFFVIGFAGVKNDLICLALSLMSMLELLVLKNLTQRTSQRLKRPSGAQVMIC